MVPVRDESRPAPPLARVVGSSAKPAAGVHVVRAGDTLYSIAWQAGLDFRRIAQWNRIQSPYLIKPGQRIVLAPHAAPITPNRRAVQPATPPQRTPTPQAQSPLGPLKKWVWPADGRVVGRFSPNGGNKGIDIAGPAGAAVRAAAEGRVVYAGTGLRGYGRLIIVKHNETFLSAYAHNRRMLVEEGQTVGAGQKIAEMGDSGAKSVKLHFEIRQKGQPVDPLRYLPRI